MSIRDKLNSLFDQYKEETSQQEEEEPIVTKATYNVPLSLALTQCVSNVVKE